MCLILLLVGCKEDASEILSDQSELVTHDSANQSPSTSFNVERSILEVKKASFDSYVQPINSTGASNLLRERNFPKTRTIPYTYEKREIKFGKGNFPSIRKFELSSGEKIHIEPEITPASPFKSEIYERVNFQSLGLNQGLKSLFIYSIFLDSRGYFWFGSRRGISRYDGQRIHYYQLVNDSEHKSVSAIGEDKDGNLWLTFGSSGGLMKFDGYDFYDYQNGIDEFFNEPYLAYLNTDQAGNSWLKSEHELVKMNGSEMTCYPYQFQDFKNLNIIMKNGEEQKILISALGGICIIQNDEMTYLPIEGPSEHNLCHPVKESAAGLIITTGTGVTILKDDSLHIYNSRYFDDFLARSTLAFEDQFFVSSDEVNLMCSVNDSALTIIADDGPLFNDAFPHILDNYGNVWLGTNGEGVLRYQPKAFERHDLTRLTGYPNVSAFAVAPNGDIWMGSHGFGLIRYDGQMYHHFTLSDSVDYVVIRSMVFDNQNQLWIGTVDHGLFKLNQLNENEVEVERVRLFGENNFSVYALCSDQLGNIWIGTAEKGLIKHEKGQFERFNLSIDNEQIFIRALIVDQQNKVWIGAQNGGLMIYDGVSFRPLNVNHGLTSSHVVSLLEDSNGNIWIGSNDQGVDFYDGKEFIHLGIADGLTSETIWTISEDNNGNIWLGADNCLNVLLGATNQVKPENISIRTFCEPGGIAGGEFYANASLKDQNGKLWWGTDKMVVSTTNQVASIEQGLKISLNDINIANTPVDFRKLNDSIENGNSWMIGIGDQVDLTQASFDQVLPYSNCPINLKLSAELNDLTFIFSVAGANDPSNLEFSYLLEGIDKEWSIPSRENQIHYRGLEAGNYTLKAKASEIKGLWSEEFSYTFYIAPPWYRSYWAFTLWIVVLLILFFGIYKVILARSVQQSELKKMKEIESLRSQLYTNITHEFRTPLTLIMGATEQIDQHANEKKIIAQNSQRLLQQINNLLDAAKLEAGQLQLSLIQSDINQYLKFLVANFIPVAERKKIKLNFYHEDLEIWMDFDEEKIQLILYNLISNAIKFTEEGGEIMVHSSKVSQKGSFFQLKIKDSGTGIPEDELEKIYDRFYQTKRSQSAQFSGTGIGLALTKDLIELMGGKIDVESKIGKGTIFTIQLPITNNAKKETEKSFRLSFEPSNLVNENQELVSVADHEGLKILLVEDNLEIAQFVLSLLNEFGYQAQWVKNGEEGINEALSSIPDLIISDVAMPVKDGWELCQTIKGDELTSHVPIILLTAKSTDADKIKGLKYGADAYMTKPFSKKELETRIDQLIENRKRIQAHYLKFGLEKQNNDSNDNNVELQFILKLKEIVLTHLNSSEFGVPELAEKAKMSQMQIYRKLKALTDKTPSQFIRSIRLARGMELLKEGKLNVSEVAYEVGFSDPNYFSRTFHTEFGNPPGHFLNDTESNQ